MTTFAQILTNPGQDNDNTVLQVEEDTELELWEIEWRPVMTYAVIEVTEATGPAQVGWKFRDGQFHKPGGGPPDV